MSATAQQAPEWGAEELGTHHVTLWLRKPRLEFWQEVSSSPGSGGLTSLLRTQLAHSHLRAYFLFLLPGSLFLQMSTWLNTSSLGPSSKVFCSETPFQTLI